MFVFKKKWTKLLIDVDADDEEQCRLDTALAHTLTHSYSQTQAQTHFQALTTLTHIIYTDSDTQHCSYARTKYFTANCTLLYTNFFAKNPLVLKRHLCIYGT